MASIWAGSVPRKRCLRQHDELELRRALAMDGACDLRAEVGPSGFEVSADLPNLVGRCDNHVHHERAASRVRGDAVDPQIVEHGVLEFRNRQVESPVNLATELLSLLVFVGPVARVVLFEVGGFQGRRVGAPQA